TGSGGYFLHAFDGCGREPAGWPKFTGHWIISTPAVGDIDGDHKLDVVIGTRDGWLYAWHTEGQDDGIIEWESVHHDNKNSGTLEAGLEQGTKGKKAKPPLTVDTCMVGTGGSGGGGGGTGGGMHVEPAGGCSCSTPERDGAPYAGLGAALLGLAAARRRRRR